MKKLIALLLTFPALNVFAATLNLDNGIDVLMLNGEKITVDTKADQYSLKVGQNQVVAEFAGNLTHKGKREYLSTKPYILHFDGGSDVTLSLITKSYDDLEDLSDNSQPIFVVKGATNAEQEVLPSDKSFLPYGDIVELVEDYNTARGLNYGVATATVAVATPVVYQQQTEQELKTLDDTDTLNQLKHWYMQATEEEKVEFKQWLIFN